MKVFSTKFKGLKVIKGENHLDRRGAFREVFIKNKMEEFNGIFWCMSKSKKMFLEECMPKQKKLKRNLCQL